MTVPEHLLTDGTSLPMLGIGLYKVEPGNVEPVVDAGLEAGLRLFDTATMYGNEAALGGALARAGASDAFVATKVLNADQGRQSTLDAARRSRDLLAREVIDLYLIHWPAPRQDRYVETWEAMVQLQEEGVVRSIGVSNFHVHHLDRLEAARLPRPVLNQVELHPWLPQNELHAVHLERGILTQAWSPLARGRILDEPVLVEIADSLDVTVAEVVLAWHLTRGIAVVAKSDRPERVRQNAEATGIRLTNEHMNAIGGLENGTRTGVDPDDRD